MREVRAVIGKGGHINIPAEHRRALGLKEGDAVLVGISEGERAIRIQTREASLARARSMVRPYLSDEGTSMSEELLRSGGRKQRLKPRTLRRTLKGALQAVSKGRTQEARVVLDASAVLALLEEESGSGEVEAYLGEAAISTVNFTEVVGKLAERGVSRGDILDALSGLALSVEPFDSSQAAAAGIMKPETWDRGLSLADRACVALARSVGITALTTDRAWDRLEGVEVIR